MVVVASIVGLTIPAAGPHLEWTVTPLVVFLVYGSVRNLRSTRFSSGSIGGLVVALFVSLAVLPASSVAIGSPLLPRGVLVGVAMISSGPATAGSAIIWTRMSGGSDMFAALIAVVSIVFAPVAMPVLFSALLTESVSLPVVVVVRQLALVVGGGLFLAVAVPTKRVDEGRLNQASLLAILVLVYTAIAANDIGGASVSTLTGIGMTTLAVCVIGLVCTGVASVLLGFSRRQALAMFFGGTMKNLGIPLLLITTVNAAVFAVVGYYVVQQLFAATVADVV